MPAQPFPFITDGIHGDVPNNFYPASDSDKQSVLLPTGGLKTLVNLTDCTEIRGVANPYNDYLYAVARRGSESIFWRVDPAGSASELGTITTSFTGPVWITNNDTQLCIVDGVWGYIYTPSSGIFVAISDTNFPGASSVDYQDGYGLFSQPGTNKWFFSAIQDFSKFDALDFYSKESKPDNIMGLKSFRREPWLFGTSSGSEVWYNAGGDNSSANNPTFARNTGGLIPYACGAAGTILPESRTNPETVLRWLSSQGELVQAAGYNGQVISNQMFARAVRGDGTLKHPGFQTFADAISFDFKDQGHEFTQVTFPSGNQTWVYDAATKLFHKRQSYLDDGSGFGRHRANCYALLNNKHYVGDYSNGNIYEMSVNYFDDAGQDIQRVFYSQEIDGGMTPISFPNVQLIVEPGVGLENGLDPQIILEFSEDYGNTWSNEVWQSAGKIGDYMKQAIWTQMGQGYRRIYRITMSDPVLWRVLGMSFGDM
jgi:hypothetical protein